jgi:putative ABC transport system permease protein
MKLLRLLKMSFSSIKLNKTRTFLSMLGVIVGVSSLILITSFGYGAQYSILSSIQALGSDVVIVFPGRDSTMVSAAIGVTSSGKPLTYDDVKYLKLKVPNAKFAPQLTTSSYVKYENAEYSTTVVGTNEDLINVSNYKLKIGRNFNEDDILGNKNVCIVGSKIAQQLFNGDETQSADQAMGKSVKVLNGKFHIIGVLEPQGAFGALDLDKIVFVPITTIQTLINKRNLQSIYAKAPPDISLELFGARVKRLLLIRHGTENFTIRNQEQYLQLASQVTNIFTVALTAIGLVALIVGGIGIMNIMLASVAERTREIGIRKAIGAKNRDILLQFLFESAFVSVTGGVIGILLGTGISKLFPQTLLQTRVTPTSVFVGFFVSLLIGIFFGVYPARKASLLNPVEALRYE